MDKRFDPSTYEQKWQRFWAENEFFRAAEASDREPYCIMIPPPNVTGELHIGHALQSTIQDLLIRWRRMQGRNALWLPGTDHAGIAVQLMVERHLESRGESREELGREAFLERVWEWKHEYHGNIRRQLDQLGASCDWSRERFTLDEGLSRAVRYAFVELHRRGLVHRGEYMVNWSPGLDTAVSDLEVEMKEVEGRLYHIAYPIEGSDDVVVVATTRPETMLGDTGVAYHPEDERYRHLAGRSAVLPIQGRSIPFVADEYVERDFGSGLVKVTPFHDPNDFEIGKRHDLPAVQVIDRRGRMTAEAGPDFEGLDRFEARQRVVERLEAEGRLTRSERYVHNVGHCQRSGVSIEPLISIQWFLDVSEMAARALRANRAGRLALVPESWEKTWEHWLENIRPWCISRQLWWGHQIPAWYDESGNCYVAESEDEAVEMAGTTALTQDPDVLDTWFSSGLWPMSTLGWPEPTRDFDTFYPTQVLVTGFDILFFWVARMVMFGLEFTDEVPFDTVHLTGLVRDAEGQKMSKTKGNTVDPLELVDEFGADALRFTLAALDSPGRDVPLDLERMAGYRAFGNKIWNAVRFVLSNLGEGFEPEAIDAGRLEAPERWIRSRLATTAAEVDASFEAFRFDEACHRLYHFFWGELCDWYLELTKPALHGGAERPFVREVLLETLDESLRLLHPTMPFLTEELWQRLPGTTERHGETIALAPFPEHREAWEDRPLETAMNDLFEIVTAVRRIRSDLGLPPRTELDLHLAPENDVLTELIDGQRAALAFLCGLGDLVLGAPPEGSARDRAGATELGVVVPEQALGDEERARLEKEAARLEELIAAATRQLENRQFLDKAPPEVVEGKRQSLRELERRLRTVEAGL
ncbi:MAG: valine--tRNA ligase [Thermoanaerobaculia bacterium]|nr:valine--tRNA ligase [Thermoanaerobaculia bacterium]